METLKQLADACELRHADDGKDFRLMRGPGGKDFYCVRWHTGNGTLACWELTERPAQPTQIRP